MTVVLSSERWDIQLKWIIRSLRPTQDETTMPDTSELLGWMQKTFSSHIDDGMFLELILESFMYFNTQEWSTSPKSMLLE